jgi:hypothetical protein
MSCLMNGRPTPVVAGAADWLDIERSAVVAVVVPIGAAAAVGALEGACRGQLALHDRVAHPRGRSSGAALDCPCGLSGYLARPAVAGTVEVALVCPAACDACQRSGRVVDGVTHSEAPE